MLHRPARHATSAFTVTLVLPQKSVPVCVAGLCCLERPYWLIALVSREGTSTTNLSNNTFRLTFPALCALCRSHGASRCQSLLPLSRRYGRCSQVTSSRRSLQEPFPQPSRGEPSAMAIRKETWRPASTYCSVASYTRYQRCESTSCSTPTHIKPTDTLTRCLERDDYER